MGIAQVDFDAFHLGDENKVIACMGGGGGGGGNLDNAHKKVCFFVGRLPLKIKRQPFLFPIVELEWNAPLIELFLMKLSGNMFL